jgi:hypothetical protein
MLKLNSKTQTTLMAFATLALLVLQYQNCSNYADPSPFAVTDSASTGAAASSPSQAKLDSPVGVLDVGQYDLSISIGGECNVGFSTQHYIEIQLQDSSNQPIAVRQDTLCPANGVGLPSDCFRATQFRCEHGHYNILLPLNCGAYRNQSQGLYRLLGQLVTYDSNNNEVRDNKAAFDRFFQISWAPNACP